MKTVKMIGTSVLIVSFLMVGICHGQSAAEQNYDKGVEYASQGLFKEAKEEFEKTLKVDPLFDPAKNLLRFIEDLTAKRIEEKAAIHFFKGIACHNKRQSDRAIFHYTKAIEIDPRFADAYINRGLAYDSKGQFDQAISDYNKAIELNPRDADAYYHRGNTYRRKDQYEQAVFNYNKAIEINPRDAYAYYNRGIAYFYIKEYDNAWSDVNKAQALGCQINPGFLTDLREASDRER